MVNIIVNPGFEQGIPPWDFSYSGAWQAQVGLSPDALSGVYCALIDIAVDDPTGWLSFSQEIPFAIGDYFNFDLYVKGSIGGYIHIACFDANWNSLGYWEVPFNPSVGYMLVSGRNMGPVPAGTTTVTFIINPKGVGTLQIDDVYVETTIPTETGFLDVKSFVDGTEISTSVTIEGVGESVTPALLELPVGTYLITSTYNGQTIQQTVDILVGQTTFVNLQFSVTPVSLTPLIIGGTILGGTVLTALALLK